MASSSLGVQVPWSKFSPGSFLSAPQSSIRRCHSSNCGSVPDVVVSDFDSDSEAECYSLGSPLSDGAGSEENLLLLNGEEQQKFSEWPVTGDNDNVFVPTVQNGFQHETTCDDDMLPHLDGLDEPNGEDLTDYEGQKPSASPYFTLQRFSIPLGGGGKTASTSSNTTTGSVPVAVAPFPVSPPFDRQNTEKEYSANDSPRPKVRQYDINKLQKRRASNMNAPLLREHIRPPPLLENRRSLSCIELTDLNKMEEHIAAGALTMPTSKSEKHVVTSKITKKMLDIHKVTSPKKLQKMLKDPNIDPNVRNAYMDTPLHTLIRKINRTSRSELLITLLSCGRHVDIDAYDGNDNTALHLAVLSNDMATIKLLVAFGANVRMVDAHQQFAVDLAEDGGEIKEFLNEFVSRPQQFTSVTNRHRGYTLPIPHCTPDMLGFYLNWRREARLCLDMETEINRLLRDEDLNDISAASSAFMQLNHINKWKQTRGRLTAPGSRVLFLDGGGIRGLIALEILMEIENRTGHRIIDLFDWIVGTSTGGIIALALVYGRASLTQVRDFYIKMCPLIFTGGFLQAVQNSANMEKLLHELFKEMTMDCIREPKVMVSAVNISETSLKVEFFNNFEDDKRMEHLTNVSVWKVARAISAAPMYFTSFNSYVDGGVKANNPCEFAMSEIRRYFHSRSLTPPHFPIMVSIGTGYFPAQKMRDDFDVSFKHNLKGVLTPKNLFDLLIYAISDSEEVAKKFKYQCKELEIPFFRFNPYFPEEVKANEIEISKLVDMMIETKTYLMSGEVLADLYEMVQVFHQLEDLGESVTDFF